jgi:hypothetical protein
MHATCFIMLGPVPSWLVIFRVIRQLRTGRHAATSCTSYALSETYETAQQPLSATSNTTSTMLFITRGIQLVTSLFDSVYSSVHTRTHAYTHAHA